jgi:uncharacterized membrane protein YdjX (TVP38/TMEM64 family)
VEGGGVIRLHRTGAAGARTGYTLPVLSSTEPSQPGRAVWPRAVAALAVAALAVAVALAPRDTLARLAAASHTPGPGVVALLAVAYLAAGVLLVPTPLVHVVAGFVLGPVAGAALAIPASTAASCAAFALGRWLVRARAARALSRWPALAALGDAVGASGFRVVLLLRLAPFAPFTVLNYALGATGVRLRDFALASLVGSVPGLLLDVYVGSLAADAEDLLSASTGLGGHGPWSLAASAVATGLVMLGIAWVLRRTLRGAAAAAGEPEVDTLEAAGAPPALPGSM